MGVYRGDRQLVARYLGEQRIGGVYLGDEQLWSDTRLVDMFDDVDANGLPINIDLEDTGRWTDLGSSTDHKAAVYNGTMRLDLPDGLLAQLHRTSRARFNSQHATDDGYIEVKPATRGNGSPPIFSGATYTTDIFRRGNNSGSTHTHGVGIRMRESQLYIVSRISSTDAERADCGTFAPNDVIKLVQSGNLHTMLRNGNPVGEWNDTGGLAQKGSSYRSLIVRVDASKDLLGPRRFSPALDYVICT